MRMKMENFAQLFLQDLASKPDSAVVPFQDKTAVGALQKRVTGGLGRDWW